MFNRFAIFISRVFAIALVVFFSQTALFAQEKNSNNLNNFFATTQNPDKIKIKVAYDKNYGVINNLDSLDRKGFGYEILLRAQHYSNFEFEFVEYNYIEALEALYNGEIDIVGIALDDGEFIDNFTKVPKILGTSQLILASKEEGNYYDNPAAFDGKTVASFSYNPYEKYLNAYCEANGIEVNYVYGEFNTYLDLDADFYLITTIDKNARDFYMVMNFEVFPMYFIAQKGNTKLANDLAEAITLSISADGRLLEHLQLKYYGSKNLTRRFLTTSELELLRSRILSCGYIDHHQPIQYTNENGEADGLSVQIMDTLAKKFDFKIDYMPYNHTMPSASHEKFDIIISATGDFVHERAFYTPSAPYFEMPIMLFAKDNLVEQILSEETPSVLGMLNYITLDQRDVSERYPNNKVIYYDTFELLMEGYKNNEIEGILATEHGVEYAQTVLGEEQYSIRSTGLTLPLRIFISNNLQNLTEYIGAFNIMFEHVSQSTIDEIVSTESVSFLPEYTIQSFIQENLIPIIALVFLILFTLGATILYSQLKSKKAILKIINYDELTGLISTYNFNNRIKQILQTSNPNEYEIISIDIDSFHTINKIYGLEKGNEVIKVMAKTLEVAYAHTDSLITRVIADQFLIFNKLENAISIDSLCQKALYPAIRSVLGGKYNLSMSVGSCTISDCAIHLNEITDSAVVTRQKGKKHYKFTHYSFDENIKKELEMNTSIVYRMQEALHNKEFKIVYQPKISFDTLKISSAEALVRWHSDNKITPPDAFITIFESNGFIVNLDLYVFEEVCKFIVENDKNLEIPLISVNLSAVTLFDNCFPTAYLDILSKYELSPEKIELEITESAMAFDLATLINKIRQIRQLGFNLSIDDFGAGESSLNRLKSIEADYIKLDKAFLDYNIAKDRGSIVVDNVIRMVKQLHMKVVTEGVETAEQARWLKSLNCDYAQGYYFEKPLSEQNFIKVLESGKTYSLED